MDRMPSCCSHGSRRVKEVAEVEEVWEVAEVWEVWEVEEVWLRRAVTMIARRKRVTLSGQEGYGEDQAKHSAP